MPGLKEDEVLHLVKSKLIKKPKDMHMHTIFSITGMLTRYMHCNGYVLE